MALKLGTLLVREGIITPHQLEEALRVQVIYGGRLGTNLVELGYVDADVLAEWLGRSMGFPVATQEMFDESPTETIELVPAELAEKFECFPLRQEGRRLHLALVAPADLATIDALSFKTGLRIVPYVTSELRLHFYLEKRYGLMRKMRYIRLSPREMASIRPGENAVPQSAHPSSSLPPPPNPYDSSADPFDDAADSNEANGYDPSREPSLSDEWGGPIDVPGGGHASPDFDPFPAHARTEAPVHSASVLSTPAPQVTPAPAFAQSAFTPAPNAPASMTPPPMMPAPFATPAFPTPAPEPSVDAWGIDGPGDEWVAPVPAPTAGSSWLGDGVEKSHDWTPPAIPAEPTPAPVEAAAEPATARQLPALDFDAALAGLEEAETRESLAECLLGFGSGVLDGVLLLAARDGMALGWRARFDGVDEPQVESLMLPLNVPSPFQTVSESAEPWVGAVPDNVLIRQMYKALRRAVPRSVALVPVVVRGQVVNFIYGERHKLDADDVVPPLVQLASRMTEAYERIVREARRRTLEKDAA